MSQPANESGNVWVDDSARFERMLAPFNDVILADAAIQPSERVLDVGSGSGASSLAAAAQVGDGFVVGIDRDAALVELARQRAAAIGGRASVSFVAADAASVELPAASFDVLISRFGMMLFDDPSRAFAHLGSLMRPGGRITYVTWTEPAANGWFSLPFTAMGAPVPSSGPPFRLADPNRNRELLEHAGCSRVSIETTNRDVFVGADLGDVMSFVRRALPADTDAQTLAAIEAALTEYVRDDGVYVKGKALLCTGEIGDAR